MKKIVLALIPLVFVVIPATGQTTATAHVSVTQLPCALSVTAPEPEFNLRVFPNPASGRFQVTLQSDRTIGKMEVAVVNLLGQTVIARTESGSGNKSTLVIPTTGLQAGTYFIRVNTTGFSKVERIVITN